MTNNVESQQNLNTSYEPKFKIRLIKKKLSIEQELFQKMNEEIENQLMWGKPKNQGGIYQQMQKSNKSSYEQYKNLSMEEIEKAFKELFYNRTGKRKN